DRARRSIGGAGIRPAARGRRLIGAGAGGGDGAADHRERRCGETAGGVHRSGRAGGVGGAEPRGRAELPYARSLRRRDRRPARAPARGPAGPGRGRRPPRSSFASRPDVAGRDQDPHDGASGRVLDELAAGALLDRLGITRAPAVALDAGIAQAPALPFPYPVAVKVLSAEIAHKSDIGGVTVDVANGTALAAAVRGIGARVAERQPSAHVARVLVQAMVAGLGEALVGYRVDRDVGPLVMVAAGGLFTEIARDRSLRLAPVDLAEAQEMIAEVRGLLPL